MSAAPRISVIVPCYNVERWLVRCLDSLFAALPESAEVIAVDDASSDGTLSVLRKRAQDEPRLKVIAAAHGGVSAARNRALDVARGTIVFFVDPDDAVEPDFFSAMEEELARTGADGCICAYCDIDDETGKRTYVSLNGCYRYESNQAIVEDFLPRFFGYSFEDVRAWYGGRPLFEGRREMGSVCRMAFRRALIEAERIRFDEDVILGEDALFISEYLLAASSFAYIGRPLYRVTGRSSGAMRTITKDGLRFCRNKLAMLRKREALDRKSGGRLTPFYAASCVLSLLELLSWTLHGRLPCREGFRIFRDYLSAGPVRPALRDFPLSLRRPLVALAVFFLRVLYCR